MSKSTQVLIVGGGIAGCATSYYLAQQGISSIIVESNGIGSKASGKSAGMLSPVHGAKEPGTIDEISLGDKVLTAPYVPTGIKTGVLIFLLLIEIVPALAEHCEELASNLNSAI